jgi:hypothetical protein
MYLCQLIPTEPWPIYLHRHNAVIGMALKLVCDLMALKLVCNLFHYHDLGICNIHVVTVVHDEEPAAPLSKAYACKVLKLGV